MLDLIQQNPLVSLVLILVPAIGVIWKIFDVLFLKPRDFRIAVLEKNVDDLRKEFQRTPTHPVDVAPAAGETPRADESNRPASREAEAEKIERLVEGTTFLNNLSAFFEAWKDESLTDLQRDQFEKNYAGQRVVWRARFQDASEKDGSLWTSLLSENEREYGVHVIAVFGSKHKEALLMLNKGEVVTISGVIDRFFLGPILKDCEIVRKA